MTISERLLELQRRVIDHAGGCIYNDDGSIDRAAVERELGRMGFDKVEYGTTHDGRFICRGTGKEGRTEHQVGDTQDDALAKLGGLVFKAGTMMTPATGSIVFKPRDIHLVFAQHIDLGRDMVRKVEPSDTVNLFLESGVEVFATIVRVLGDGLFLGSVTSVDARRSEPLKPSQRIVFREIQVHVCAKGVPKVPRT